MMMLGQDRLSLSPPIETRKEAASLKFSVLHPGFVGLGLDFRSPLLDNKDNKDNNNNNNSILCRAALRNTVECSSLQGIWNMGTKIKGLCCFGSVAKGLGVAF